MALDNKISEKIKSLVYQRPHTINEIAIEIGKNWRTADRYVEEIMLKTGTIKTKLFRGGTKGALKIAYWNNTEKIYSTDVQEQLLKKIEIAFNKDNFSPFEIYQYVDSDKRNAWFEEITNEEDYDYNIKSLIPHFKNSEKEISIYAGNLAFIHLKHNKKTLFQIIEECVKKNIIIKIITNINLLDLDNIEKVLSLNSGLKEPLIEIRHEITPLRAYIFDNSLVKLGEIAKGQRKKGQIKNTVAIYYEIKDELWIDWMQKMFWKKFQNAIKSSLRIENLKSLKKLR